MNWVILSKVLRNVDELHYKSVIECVKLLVVSIDKKVKCVVRIYLGTAALRSLFFYVQCFSLIVMVILTKSMQTLNTFTCLLSNRHWSYNYLKSLCSLVKRVRNHYNQIRVSESQVQNPPAWNKKCKFFPMLDLLLLLGILRAER